MERKTKEQQINELKEQVANLEEALRKNRALFDEFKGRVLRGGVPKPVASRDGISPRGGEEGTE